MGLKQKLIDFLSTIDEDEDGGVGEAEIDEAEAGEADAEAGEADAEAGEIDADTEAEEHADGEADAEAGEETPGTAEDGSAEDGDKDATITEQAALIETLRNTIAELGGEDPTETAADAEAEIEPDTSEDDVVAAFDTDYAERAARLAEITD